MLKKLMWLVVAVGFLCSPLWAADKDTPQKNYWIANPADKEVPAEQPNYWAVTPRNNVISQESQVFKTFAKNNSSPMLTATSGDLISASPADLCAFTAVCYGQTEPEVCVPGFPGGSLCSYQDPSKTCPVPPATCPAYPFEVKTIYVKLCNPGPDPCDVQVIPAILDAKDSLLSDGTICHVPGAMLCNGPQIIITIPPNSPCQVYPIQLTQPCCVYSDYFACLDIKVLGGPACQMGVCTDQSCQPCCDYWQPAVGASWDDLCLPGGAQLPGNLGIWTDGLHSCQNTCGGVHPDTTHNHYKTWRVTPWTIGTSRRVVDQFMDDNLQLLQLEYLSNPVRKIVFGPIVNDTFNISDPDDHLTWYRANGRDTLLRIEYVNQFESTKVEIDSVKYLLVPAQKDGHLPPDSLDHYKAYRIRNPQTFSVPVQLEDQFDRSMGTVENVTSLIPVYFLTPCQKYNASGLPEPTYDMSTHYVAYIIPPMNYTAQPRFITDQFLANRTIDVFNSQFLLVPTRKIGVGQPMESCCLPGVPGGCTLVPVGSCVAAGGVVVPACLGDGNGNGQDDACEQPTVDTLRNHFKTWRVLSPPKDTFALVRDQFTIHDFLFVDSVDFLSNPVRKIVSVPPLADTFDITRPDDHLTWYRVKSSNHRRINVQVTYVDQFESTKVFIDTVKYLLLPTQKLLPPHPAPDTLLGHYTAYRIHKPKGFKRQVLLDDQFDATPEPIDSLVPRYFLTPADKNNELRPKSDTHYVAYEIFPKTPISAFPTTQTIDQWGGHAMQVRNSEYLLVPAAKRKVVFCTYKPNDCDGNGTINLTDIICDVNVVFKGAPKPNPNCRCDSNGDGTCTLTDIIHKVNFVFKNGPEPVPVGDCCIPVK